jgi:hypothetical protein
MRAGFWLQTSWENCMYTCIWQDNTEMGFKGVGWEGTDWIHLTQYRSKWTGFCEHGNAHTGSVNCRAVLE